MDVYSNFSNVYVHTALSKTASVWYKRGTTVQSSAYLDVEKGIKKDSQRLPWVYQIIFFLLNLIYNHYALSGIQLVFENEYPMPLACTYVIERGDFSCLSPRLLPFSQSNECSASRAIMNASMAQHIIRDRGRRQITLHVQINYLINVVSSPCHKMKYAKKDYGMRCLWVKLFLQDVVVRFS